MSKHVHEWRWHSQYAEDGIDCRTCDEEHGYRPENWMDRDETIRRLNAVEMLSAKAAMSGSYALSSSIDDSALHPVAGLLRAYAAALLDG